MKKHNAKITKAVQGLPKGMKYANTKELEVLKDIRYEATLKYTEWKIMILVGILALDSHQH